ncbi:Lysocardiolipin acyltransferase 1 [Lamellibrachia satsuma]|nr:Lysocardiolipin acyltransferase 1 [Lamellibrachia satsuma]
MSATAALRGIVFAVLLFLSSFVGILFFSSFLTPVWLIRPDLYRHVSDKLIAIWEFYIVSLLEVFLNVRVVISGDRIRPRERNVIMMNHRTRLDWMYFWSVLVRQSGASTEKIILKSPLKHIPGAGWAMQQVAFMFIDRQWDRDRKVLTYLMNHYTDLNVNMQILIFPEGTDLTKDTKERSHAYAKKYNLDCYNGMLDAGYDGSCGRGSANAS